MCVLGASKRPKQIKQSVQLSGEDNDHLIKCFILGEFLENIFFMGQSKCATGYSTRRPFLIQGLGHVSAIE